MNVNVSNVWIVSKKKRLASGKIAVYRTLQWPAGGVTASGRPKITSESLGGRVTKGKAEELRKRKIAALASGEAPINRPEKITLGVFRDLYLQRRASRDDTQQNKRHKVYPKLKSTTLVEHDMALRYIITKFGEHKQLATITEPDISDFLEALEAGELEAARRGQQVYGLSEQTIRKHVRTCRAIWNWARYHHMVTINPFGSFHARPLPTPPGAYVSIDDLDAVLQKCPTPGWRAMFALCRFAGLRRDEARTLPWSARVRDHLDEWRQVGVDWEGRRLRIVSTKNRRYRVVPMTNRLHDVMLEVFAAALEGDHTISGLGPHDLTRHGQVIVQAAGVTAWPKLYQAMRVSRENDWKEAGVAESTYATWLGHSVTVSRTHYVSPQESEFAAAAERV